MKKIRIGNDIIIKATVTRLGVAEELTDKQITLTLHSPYESRQLSFERTGNVLTSTWLGTEQEKAGTYTLTLRLDYGEGSRNTVDCEDFITLVSRTSQEGLTGEQTVTTTLNVNQSSEGVSQDVDLAITAPATNITEADLRAYERKKNRERILRIPHGPVRLRRAGNIYYSKSCVTLNTGSKRGGAECYETVNIIVEKADGINACIRKLNPGAESQYKYFVSGTYRGGVYEITDGQDKCFTVHVVKRTEASEEGGIPSVTLRIGRFANLPKSDSTCKCVWFENGMKQCDYTPTYSSVRETMRCWINNFTPVPAGQDARPIKGLYYLRRKKSSYYYEEDKDGNRNRVYYYKNTIKRWQHRFPRQHVFGDTLREWKYRVKRHGKFGNFFHFYNSYKADIIPK